MHQTVQLSSVTQPCLTLCDPMDCCTSGFPVHHQLLKLAQTHVHWVCDVIQPSSPLSSPSPPALIFPSIRVFPNESVLHIMWPEYWSFSFSISPSNKNSGLISFRIDWLDLCNPRDSQEPSPTWRHIINIGQILTDRKGEINKGTWKDAQHHRLSAKWKSKLWSIPTHRWEGTLSKHLHRRRTREKGTLLHSGGNVNWYNNYGEEYRGSLKN